MMVPLSDQLTSFLEMLAAEKGLADNTLKAYESDLLDWFSFLKAHLIFVVTPAVVEEYISHLYASDRKARTVARRLSTLRLFYLFNGNTSLFQSILLPRYTTPLPRDLSYQEMALLLETAQKDSSAKGLRLWALLELLYATGMRISELLVLPINGFHSLAPDTPFLITGKGGHQRSVFLTPAACDALQAYLAVRSDFATEESPFLFPSGNSALTRQRVGQLLKELAVHSGLDPEKVSPHKIRHAFATHLLSAGMDLVMLQTLLGHQDISTTQVYTHVSQHQLLQTLMDHHPLADKG